MKRLTTKICVELSGNNDATSDYYLLFQCLVKQRADPLALFETTSVKKWIKIITD